MRLLTLLLTKCNRQLAQLQCVSSITKTFLELQLVLCPHMVEQLGYQEQAGLKALH